MTRGLLLSLCLAASFAAPVFAQAKDPAPPVLRLERAGRPVPAGQPVGASPPDTSSIRSGRQGTPSPRPRAARGPADPVEQGLREAAGFLRQGRVEEGIRRLQELQGENPGDFRVMQALGRTLEGAGRSDDAIALYRRVAAASNDPGPALVELQRAQRGAEDWAGALDTCLEYLARVGDRDTWVADEVESLVRTDRIGPQAILALEKAHAARPDDVRLRELLVIARLHQGEADKAIEEAAAMDREQKARGAYLVRYANMALEKGLYPAALRGFDRVLQLDPAGEVRDGALLRRARALRELGRLPESAAGYEDAARSGSPAVRTAALAERADLLAGKMGRPADAIEAYSSLLSELRRGSAHNAEGTGADAVTPDRVRLAMAELRIRLEQPGEAAALYRELADSSADSDVRAEALYHAGEMLFYQGKLREAQDTWYEVVDNYPQSRWDNDALAGVLMVGANTDDGGMPLAALAQAMYQRRLGRPERGIEVIDESIARYPRTRAGDRLRHERVLLLLDLSRTADARVEADSLAVRYPDSALGAQAFLAVAERLAADPTTEAEAEAVYLELLTRFPDSLEASRARAALQKARDRNRGNSAREPIPPPSPAPGSSGRPSPEGRG